MAGMVFEEQEEAAIFLDSIQATFTMAGFSVQSTNSNSAAVIIHGGGRSHSGSISLVDGRIELPLGSRAIINSDKNVYLKNLYFGGGMEEITGATGTNTVTASGLWTRVGEYSYTGRTANSIIEGVVRAPQYELKENIQQDLTTAPDVESLIRTHVWERVPSFEDDAVVDATEVDPAILDDASTDVRARLQAVIDAHDQVFLPKGNYRMSDTLLLRSNTKLFGTGKTFTSLSVGSGWNNAEVRPLVQTVDDASGNTFLGDLFLYNEAAQTRAMHLDWRVGKNSIYKDVFLAMDFYNERFDESDNNIAALRIRGSGGGRFYGVAGEFTFLQRFSFNDDFRQLLVDGTTEPLKFYGLNIERSHSEVQAEVRNSS